MDPQPMKKEYDCFKGTCTFREEFCCSEEKRPRIGPEGNDCFPPPLAQISSSGQLVNKDVNFFLCNFKPGVNFLTTT